jgi:D-alanyl-D-alanine endopeptidase (penicillin-binding protein 7)
MRDTSFVDASGLDDDNVSTSSSLIKLVLAAQEYPLIVKSSQTPHMRIKLDDGYFSYKNTNPLVSKKFIVSKTGYIRAAGGCIALLMDTNKGKRVVVILGSKNTHTRIPEVKYLVRNF